MKIISEKNENMKQQIQIIAIFKYKIYEYKAICRINVNKILKSHL